MSAAPLPRCGKPMRRYKGGSGVCGLRAGHAGKCLSDTAYRRRIAKVSARRGQGLIVISSHGYAGYSAGCRCEVCTTAKAAYMAAKRADAANAARPGVAVMGVTHGTRAAYKDKGCRCGRCTEFMRDYWRREFAARRAA